LANQRRHGRGRRKDELDFGLRYKRLDILDNFLRQGLKWGSLAFIAYIGRDTIASLAGQYTFADIGISFLGKLSITQSIQYGLIGSLSFWGVQERRLRRSTIARLAPRIEELEKLIDSKRTSSKLTLVGTTRPEDKL
jgi:hypothetical protein